MNISARLTKLERNESLTGPPTVMDRLAVALERASRGPTLDRAAADLVLQTTCDEFLPGLSDADLATLMAELERIVFGDDTAAAERARREAVRYNC